MQKAGKTVCIHNEIAERAESAFVYVTLSSD